MTMRSVAFMTAALALGSTPVWPQNTTPAPAPAAPAAAPAPIPVQPSLTEEAPVALDEPFDIEATVPEEFTGRSHYYVFKCRSAGVHEMVVRFSPVDATSHSRLIVWVPDAFADGRARYDVYAGEWHFYPVLTAEEHAVAVSTVNEAPGDRYSISLRPDPCPVTDAITASARLAVQRGTAFLLGAKPADLDYSRQHAIESLVLMALLGPKESLPKLDEDYIAWLAAAGHPDEKGTWHDQPVTYFGDNDALYDQSIIALAAAEAVSTGSETARPLAAAAQQYVLAAQLTSRRCQAWGPVNRDELGYGGWRYSGNSTDADISVTGWCMVALMAGDAAGIRDPGLRDSLEDGTAFVRRCFGTTGFAYMPKAESGDVRDAIGALIMLLMGENGDELKFALQVLDHHLYAGSLALTGEAYPFYYAYYATRTDYLRAGRPWDTWRSVTMRQLVRLQKPDGSWAGFGQEENWSNRYATALAVMTLRICLNDVPAYLQHEARGF
jgi:hypothetical protein